MKTAYYAVQDKGGKLKYYTFGSKIDRDRWVASHVRAVATTSRPIPKRAPRPPTYPAKSAPTIYHSDEANAYLIIEADTGPPYGYVRWQAPFPRLRDAGSRYYWWTAGEPSAREIGHYAAAQRLRAVAVTRARYLAPRTPEGRRARSRINRLQRKVRYIESRMRFWPTDTDVAMLTRLREEISTIAEEFGLTRRPG